MNKIGSSDIVIFLFAGERSRLIALLIIIISPFIGCKRSIPVIGEQNTIEEIDLINKITENQFLINRITDELRLIKLETNSNSFITYFSGFIGRKHIISFNQDKVILFSSSGDYMYTIAKNGKGPNDFIGIDGWDVDSDEKYLIFHDYGRKYLNRFNLETANFETNIPCIDITRITNLQLINDTLIYILPYLYSGSNYLFYQQNFSGRIVGGINRESVSHKGPWTGRLPIFMKTSNGSIIFHPSESDTIFMISGNDLKPIFTIKTTEPHKNGNITSGTYVSLQAICKESVILRRSDFEIERTEKSLSSRSLKNDYVKYDINKKIVEVINPLILEYSGIRLKCPNIVSFINDNQFLAVYQATEFKKSLMEALKSESEIKNREKITSLYDQINDNDNPILIVGTLK
jgi:hypothetical protein